MATTVSHACAWAISRACCCFCRTRASVVEVRVDCRRPPRGDGTAKYRRPTSTTACSIMLTGLHRREATRLLGEVLLQIVLEQKGLVRQASHEEHFLLHCHRCVSNPDTQQGHHRVGCCCMSLFLLKTADLGANVTKGRWSRNPLQARWSFIDRAGWP